MKLIKVSIDDMDKFEEKVLTKRRRSAKDT